jgi:hypothetical protein
MVVLKDNRHDPRMFLALFSAIEVAKLFNLLPRPAKNGFQQSSPIADSSRFVIVSDRALRRTVHSYFRSTMRAKARHFNAFKNGLAYPGVGYWFLAIEDAHTAPACKYSGAGLRNVCLSIVVAIRDRNTIEKGKTATRRPPANLSYADVRKVACFLGAWTPSGSRCRDTAYLWYLTISTPLETSAFLFRCFVPSILLDQARGQSDQPIAPGQSIYLGITPLPCVF